MTFIAKKNLEEAELEPLEVDFSRIVPLGGEMVAPNDVRVAKGYSATENLE